MAYEKVMQTTDLYWLRLHTVTAGKGKEFAKL